LPLYRSSACGACDLLVESKLLLLKPIYITTLNMLPVCRQKAPDANACNVLSAKIRLKCLVTGQQDLAPPCSTPTAPSEALFQLLPTEGAAAPEQVAQRKVAEAPAAAESVLPSHPLIHPQRTIEGAHAPVYTRSDTRASEPQAANTTDDGTTQKTVFAPMQQPKPTTSDLAMFFTIAGASAAIGALCCLIGAVVLRMYARHQVSTALNSLMESPIALEASQK